MADSWTPTPGGVRRGTTGPSRAASIAASLLTIVGTTLALVIAAAILFPGTYGGDGGGIAVASPSTPPAAVATPVVTPGASQVAAPPSPGAPLAAASPAVAASSAPQRTPVASAAGPAPSPASVLAQMRETAPLTIAGREIGRVTVQAVREVRSASTSAKIPAGRRLMVASVRLDAATARLPYDELQWRLEDENGDRWEPVAQAAPKPLGSGTLAPDAGRSGGVGFVVPVGVRVRAVILTDGSGSDLVVFNRPSVSG